MPVGWQEYRGTLEKAFSRAEEALLKGESLPIAQPVQKACDDMFASKTQAHREVLLGCLLTRIVDKSKDIRHPYVDLGPSAFSGRSLDEQMVNPFLRGKNIPCSGGPYLSVFRRQVTFDETTRAKVRDKQGYDGLIRLLEVVERKSSPNELLRILEYVLYRFVLLREQAKVDLLRLERISLGQYRRLVGGLLAKPSGGFFPVLLVLAMVETIVERFSLSWQVESYGINVADKASGTGGDITIREHERTLVTIEVTERPVDASRVHATFKDKIAAKALMDYVFMVHLVRVGDEARQQAEKYFTQGYDVNLVDIQEWITNTLVTVGLSGRKLFQDKLLHHLSQQGVTKILRVAWNEDVEKLTA